MYEPDYENCGNCPGPPPHFHLPPPPRPDFVEFYKCPDNSINDYSICGALNIVDSGGFHGNLSTQTSAMILLFSVLLLILIFVSSIVIWNHKRKSQAYLSSHKNINSNDPSNMSSFGSNFMEPDTHNRSIVMRQLPQNVEMNNISRTLRYQMNDSPPLFICSSPGPDPYCSNENVYEELEHGSGGGGDENFIMNNVTMSEAGFIADTSSLPEENHHKNIKEAFDKQDTLRSSINNKLLNSHHNNNTSSIHRNSNNFSRFSKFNTERFLNRNSQHKRSQNDPYNHNTKSGSNGESTSSCSSGFYGEHGSSLHKTKGYDRSKVMNDVIDNDGGSKKVNEFERLIQIRKSVKNSHPNTTPMFNDFEMPYHPPKVNANFYVQSHDMMSNRRNRYRTMDHHHHQQQQHHLQEKSLKGRDYFLNHNKLSHSHDQYNNNDEGNIEVFQPPHEILSEFTTFANLKSEQPIYNNSAALSSDSGYSQNTNTLSEGTLGNQSQRNSNGNIFILSSVLNGGSSENSHATDSIS